MSLDRLGKDGVMRRITLSFALAGVLALGACGGEASPKPAPLTKTPSPSTTPPTLPSAAKGTSEAAAAAFVGYYFKALAYGSVTGDVSALEPLGLPTCKSCNNVVKEIQSLYAAGGRVSGSGFTVTQLAKSTEVGGRRVIRVRVKSQDEMVYETRTASPTVNSAASTTAEFVLAYRQGAIQVEQWDRFS